MVCKLFDKTHFVNVRRRRKLIYEIQTLGYRAKPSWFIKMNICTQLRNYTQGIDYYFTV